MIQGTIIIMLAIGILSIMPQIHAQVDEASAMFDSATTHFQNGQYASAIAIYDDILEIEPDNISTLKMKGIAQSNLGQHEKSLEQFFRILQFKPDDIYALSGMGIGMGYLGEYKESKKYFERALKLQPESKVLQNYNSHIQNILAKYPYMATEKPKQLLPKPTVAEIPPWVKTNAGLWAQGKITDSEFTHAIKFLIHNQIIVISDTFTKSFQRDIPSWVKTNAGLWSDDLITQDDFVLGLKYMIENGAIHIDNSKTQEQLLQEKDAELAYFKTYVRKITKNMIDEKRYIEFPNPSQDVIKKFLRDYIKWNFETEATRASTSFKDPTFVMEGDTIILQYIIYVNEQPSGLPLDHASTLKDSIAFWEAQELSANNQKARVNFEFTNLKADANVWVTWVVRSLGDGVLGHAHLGKGIVEVTLGDYACDGSFQLYDVDSVEQIMRHELGHSIGLTHTDDRNSIMYPSYAPIYAYCLLG